MRLAILAAALAASTATQAAPADPGPLPATWQGELPCADCAGIHHRLRLAADGSYVLDLTYRQPKGGPDRPVRESGTWQALRDGRIELTYNGARRYFAVRADGRLEALDTQGRPIASRLYRPLERDATAAPLQTGIYLLLADAPILTLCNDGRRLPVAQDDGGHALERAYLEARSVPGAPLAVSLAGHLEARPGPDGTRPDTFIVDRLDRALPGQGCPNIPALHALRWTVESLPGSGVTVPDGMRNPWLQFDPGKRRLIGATGCNRLVGEYRQWGDGRLALLGIATTRMACPAMEAEQAFLSALSRTTHLVQAANRLDLLADGVPVARLIAR